MKKEIIVIGILVFIIFVGLSGCEEKTDIENNIIGSWKLEETIITIDDNTTSFKDEENYTITTYYDNGTAKFELIGSLPRPPYAPNPGDMIWVKYKIENNNKIIYSNLTGNGTFTRNISISENGENLSLTHEEEINYGEFYREILRYIKIE